MWRSSCWTSPRSPSMRSSFGIWWPTTLGAGTNEDVVHVLRASDLLLYESGIRSRVMQEVGSGTLTVRLQIYGYLAFTAARYPASVVEVAGTGLVSPAF